MRIQNNQNLKLYVLLSVIVLLNIGGWFYSSHVFTKWTNIPPAPKLTSAKISFLDDTSLAYRVSGLTLQNFGSIGQVQNLKDYNYKYLGQWLELMDRLDPRSNFVPYLAAYYFGATPDESQLGPVVKYLEEVGSRNDGSKWRWLVQAAFLTRHRLNDMDGALRIARKLGAMYNPETMPVWARNMEPMLRADMGDKQAAYLLMLEILKSDGAKMSASEYNSNIRLICDVILAPAEALKSPVCNEPDKN